MRNIHLIISYKGTHYAGWQHQPNLLTVEAEVRRAIKAITRESVILYGSGRTDAGVHASGQSANFFTNSRITPESFATALNTKLRRDVRIIQSREMPEGFHSRYHAKGKIYTYNFYFSRILNPFYAEYSWHIDRRADLSKMQDAAAFFLGTHDFRGFMSAGSSIRSTVRTIEQIRFDEQEELLTVTYKGNGFLYNMVRIISGTLLEVGVGKIKKEAIPEIILSGDRRQAGITAPAQGLFLQEVLY